MKLSIVIPAYNEAARIGRMLDAYVPYFEQKYGDEAELIVAVNGSTDETAAIARQYAAAHPVVQVLVEPKRIGKGGAIMMGGAVARGHYIGFVDADGSTPPEAFDALLEQIGEAGLIIASRWRPDSQVSPRQPLARRVASRIFNWLVRVLFKLKITDTQCGAKLMTAAAWHAIVPRIGTTRWAFDVEMLFQTRRAHIPIVEVSTVWRDVAGSKIRIVSASFDMFLALVRLRLLHSPLSFIVRIYDRSKLTYHQKA